MDRIMPLTPALALEVYQRVAVVAEHVLQALIAGGPSFTVVREGGNAGVTDDLIFADLTQEELGYTIAYGHADNFWGYTYSVTLTPEDFARLLEAAV